MATRLNGRLRAIRTSDLETVRAWRNHPDVRKYMYTQHTIGPEEHHRWFEKAVSDQDKHLMIFERDGAPTGFVKLSIVDRSARRAEWGFYMAPGAAKGSGRMLGQLSLAYAFENLEQHKVCGETFAYNHRSIRFHERLGFTQEARLRDHYFDGNQYHDVIGFGLIAAEWIQETGSHIA